MRTLQSGLLASVALLGCFAAQAADLPAKQAAPANYMLACPAMGAGFFTIPGSETCIAFSGYVRNRISDQVIGGTVSRTVAPFSADVTFRLNTDVRSITEFGIVRGFSRVIATSATVPSSTLTVTNGSSYLNQGYIQFAGISAGLQESYFLGSNSTGSTIITTDDGAAGNQTNSAGYNAGVQTSIGYSGSLSGGFSYGVALEDPVSRLGRTSSTYYGASQYPDVVGKMGYVTGPLSLSFMGATHQNAGLTSGEIMGYAGQTFIKYTVSPETQLFAQATYAYGAMSYLGVKDLILVDHKDADLDGGSVADGYNFVGGIIQKAGPGNIQLVGTYGVSTPDIVTDTTPSDTTVTQGEINYDWSPVKNLKVIPAFAYTRKNYDDADTNSGSFRLTIRRDF